MGLRLRIVRAVVGEEMFNMAIKVHKEGFSKAIRGYCFEPVTLATLAFSAMAITGGVSAYSASQERRAAQSAANAQKDVAMKEIAATKESEKLARETATAQLRAAQAKRSKTILTRPSEMVEPNVNLKEALGV